MTGINLLATISKDKSRRRAVANNTLLTRIQVQNGQAVVVVVIVVEVETSVT